MSYVFFEKDPNLDLEQIGLLCWLKYIYKQKTFTTEDIILATTTPAVKARLLIRRLMGHGYISRIKKDANTPMPDTWRKLISLNGLKFYEWADCKEIFDHCEIIRLRA